jgi:hypothetical protein
LFIFLSDDWLLQWVVDSPSTSEDVKDVKVVPQEVQLPLGQLEPIFEPISPSTEGRVLEDLLGDPSTVPVPMIDGLDPVSAAEGECRFSFSLSNVIHFII